MTTILLLLALAGTYYVLHSRVIATAERRRQFEITTPKETGKLTYSELAKQRHDLQTARNIIKLGLVRKPDTTRDRHLQIIYTEGLLITSSRSRQFAHDFGLTPDSPRFVGFHPNCPKRHFSK